MRFSECRPLDQRLMGACQTHGCGRAVHAVLDHVEAVAGFGRCGRPRQPQCPHEFVDRRDEVHVCSAAVVLSGPVARLPATAPLHQGTAPSREDTPEHGRTDEEASRMLP